MKTVSQAVVVEAHPHRRLVAQGTPQMLRQIKGLLVAPPLTAVSILAVEEVARAQLVLMLRPAEGQEVTEQPVAIPVPVSPTQAAVVVAHSQAQAQVVLVVVVQGLLMAQVPPQERPIPVVVAVVVVIVRPVVVANSEEQAGRVLSSSVMRIPILTPWRPQVARLSLAPVDIRFTNGPDRGVSHSDGTLC